MLSISERYTRRAAVRKQALDLMARHGLVGWTFALNKRKRTLGLCRHVSQTIELSIHFIDRNSQEEILDTILHEIAHALVGDGHGHDAVWKAKAAEIGARPERCGEADMPEGRWRANCGTCGQRFSRHRKPRPLSGWFCQSCGPERGKFTWADVG